MTTGPQINLPRSQLEAIRERIDQGEAVHTLAREIGISYFGLRSALLRAKLYPDFKTRDYIKRVKVDEVREQERGFSELSQKYLGAKLV